MRVTPFVVAAAVAASSISAAPISRRGGDVTVDNSDHLTELLHDEYHKDCDGYIIYKEDPPKPKVVVVKDQKPVVVKDDADKPEIKNSANFIPIQAGVAVLGGAANDIQRRNIENPANFVPIQAGVAVLGGALNGLEKRDIENPANFVPIQAGVAVLGGALNGLEKRDIDNSANFIPIQAGVAALGAAVNGLEKRSITNTGDFIPIQAGVAALGAAANGIERRDIENSADFIPIQAAVAALGAAANGLEKRDITNTADFVPIQATVAALAGAINDIQKRDIKSTGEFVPVQAGVAVLGAAVNGIERRNITNTGSFVPIQATLAGLAEASNANDSSSGAKKADKKKVVLVHDKEHVHDYKVTEILVKSVKKTVTSDHDFKAEHVQMTKVFETCRLDSADKIDTIMQDVYKVLDPLLPCVEDKQGNRAGFCDSLVPSVQPAWADEYNKEVKAYQLKIKDLRTEYITSKLEDKCDELEEKLYKLLDPFLPCFEDKEGYCHSLIPEYQQ